MQKNQKLGKASKALFVVSLVLGVVMLILSALAIVLAAFRNNGQSEESLGLRAVEDTPPVPDKKLRLIETTGPSKLSRRSE